MFFPWRNKPNLPLPLGRRSHEQKADIESLVDQILTAKRTNPEAKLSALEERLDEMATRLFGPSK